MFRVRGNLLSGITCNILLSFLNCNDRWLEKVIKIRKGASRLPTLRLTSHSQQSVSRGFSLFKHYESGG